MMSASRKVIKSEEVKFIQSSVGVMSNAPGLINDSSTISNRSNSGRTQAELIKKIQTATQESYAKGLADGIQKGRELQKHDNSLALQTMSVIIKESSRLKREILENAEQQIVQLSLAVAEKVIHLEVTTNKDVIRGVLKAAIKKISDRENMMIRMHPQDYRSMVDIKSDFMKDFDGIKSVKFEEDESIPRGGAIIETICGEVDARIDQQYNEIKALLTSTS